MGEFVEWVSVDAQEQNEFRQEMGMPRSRAELHALEKEREAASKKGTQAEIDEKKALAERKAESLKSANERLNLAREKWEAAKVEVHKASVAFMPTYDDFKSTSADIATPTKEQLERAGKKANEQAETEFPTEGVQLTAQAMCCLFKVH